MEQITIGIDLGTTNTLAAYMKQGKPTLLKFTGGILLPSVIYVNEANEILVGKKAKKQYIFYPSAGVKSSKTWMGQTDKKWLCRDREFSPVDVATEVLKEVKSTVLKKMRCDENTVVNAVITYPAYFHGNQIEDTKQAGINAGLNVLRLVPEPMAAAIFALKEFDQRKKILIVDLGGGTFDLSLMEADIANNSYRTIDLDGDPKLGGDDFDELIMNYFKDCILDETGVDLTSHKASGFGFDEYSTVMSKLINLAEEAKIELSSVEEHEIDEPTLFVYGGKDYDLNMSLSRDRFNHICQPLYERIFSRLDDFIARQKTERSLTLDDIGTIVLAGGSCEIPYIMEEIQKRFSCEIDTELDKETLVVNGACLVADNEEKGINLIHDVISHSLGVESYENNTDILSKIIEKGTEYPCQMTREYQTVYDNQEVVEIEIYEAGVDREHVREIRDEQGQEYHKHYGTITLTGIKKAKAGEARINVTFSYDVNRCLTITAEDVDTHAKKSLTVTKETVARKKKAGGTQQPMDIVVLLDSSGSMYGPAIKQAKQACQYLFNELIDLKLHRIALINFENKPYLCSSLSHDAFALTKCLDKISADGGTNMIPAFKMARDILTDSTSNKVVIVVTDGDPWDEPESFAKRMIEAGVRIIAIGAGNSIKTKNLQAIASPDDYYKINNMQELKETFKTVVNKIMEAKA